MTGMLSLKQRNREHEEPFETIARDQLEIMRSIGAMMLLHLQTTQAANVPVSGASQGAEPTVTQTLPPLPWWKRLWKA